MGKKEMKDKKERPLEKMTAKELRELALSIGGVTGVHGMNKEELVRAVREARGEPAPETKAVKNVPVRELKAKMKELRAKKQAVAEAGDHKRADILRRKIGRLKKKTRG
jgi:hypothetical protein